MNLLPEGTSVTADDVEFVSDTIMRMAHHGVRQALNGELNLCHQAEKNLMGIWLCFPNHPLGDLTQRAQMLITAAKYHHDGLPYAPIEAELDLAGLTPRRTRMKIIAFTGPGGAGKNTAAEALATQWHTNEVAFTTPLYEMAAVALGITPEEVNQLKQQGDKTIRAMLEQLGDVVRNTIRPDYLIVHLVDTLRELEDSQDTPELAVITDLRTEDEAHWVRAMQGHVIHVNRPEGTSDSQHSTNQPITMEQGDGYLLNAGTVEDLHKEAINAVRAALQSKQGAA